MTKTDVDEDDNDDYDYETGARLVMPATSVVTKATTITSLKEMKKDPASYSHNVHERHRGGSSSSRSSNGGHVWQKRFTGWSDRTKKVLPEEGTGRRALQRNVNMNVPGQRILMVIR